MSVAPAKRQARTTTAQENEIIRVNGLSKYFTSGGMRSKTVVKAVNDVSFSIRVGEVVALVGESGSGKSTVARLLARLIEPTNGEIWFKDRNILETEPRKASLQYRRDVQMIFQDPFGSLNPVHSIAHHIIRPLKIHSKVKQRNQIMNRVHELLEIVGLTPPEEVARKYPHELSGGQRQRVAIARALAVDPEILLADEPTSMLDVSIRIGVLNLLEELRERLGIGYLYITHDIASARYFADRTLVMYAGYMVEGATSDELIHEAAHPYTQLLLSAVPNPHAGLRKESEVKEDSGEIEHRSVGCPFAPRCPKVMQHCYDVMPGTTMLNEDHWVRCHLYEA